MKCQPAFMSEPRPLDSSEQWASLEWKQSSLTKFRVVRNGTFINLESLETHAEPWGQKIEWLI